MSFTRLFNSNIHALVPNEIDLFTALCKTINSYTPHLTVAEIIHGNMSKVEYKYKKTNLLQCELSDLLIVTIKNNKVKYTFMQNKYNPSRVTSLKFSANARQQHLLSQKPQFRMIGSILPTKMVFNWSSSRYKSITSYGVFYKRKSSMYDMEYCNAQDMVLTRKNPIDKAILNSFDRQYKFEPSNINKFERITTPTTNSFDLLATTNIWFFAKNLADFYIGELIDNYQSPGSVGYHVMELLYKSRSISKVLRNHQSIFTDFFTTIDYVLHDNSNVDNDSTINIVIIDGDNATIPNDEEDPNIIE